jgi:hypothetical protein
MTDFIAIQTGWEKNLKFPKVVLSLASYQISLLLSEDRAR